MKSLMIAACLVFASISHADAPSAVTKAAAKLKKESFRTVVVKTAGNNPCDGGYAIQLQVRKAVRTGESSVGYEWETVNTVSSDSKGRLLEVCME